MSQLSQTTMMGLLSAGVYNFYTTENKNEFILGLSTDKNVIVPLLKDQSGPAAYVDAIQVDEKTYDEAIAPLIRAFFDFELLPKPKSENDPAPYKRYDPRRSAAPAHSKVITGIIRIDGAFESGTIRQALADAGYTFKEQFVSINSTPRDFSALQNDPTIAACMASDHARLIKAHADMDSLPLGAQILLKEFKAGRGIGAFFTGPSGTGKTTAASVIADALGAYCESIVATCGMGVDDLMGTFIPAERTQTSDTIENTIRVKMMELNRMQPHSGESLEEFTPRFNQRCEEVMSEVRKLIDSDNSTKWTFSPGPLLRSETEGHLLTIDEANMASPGVMVILNQATDDSPRFIYNGVTYTKHRNFIMVLTENPGFRGSNPFNEALKTRMPVINFPALTKEQLIARAKSYSYELGHELSADFFGRIFDFADRIALESKTMKWRNESVEFNIRNIQRVIDGVLLDKCSFDEFKEIIFMNYVNYLNLDHNNSEQLEAFKQESEIIDELNTIYGYYDFSVVKTVAPAFSMEDIANLVKPDVISSKADHSAEDSEIAAAASVFGAL